MISESCAMSTSVPWKNVSRALRITFVAKYLERIGDHATNIAQMVIFMCEGLDVRHPAAQDLVRRDL